MLGPVQVSKNVVVAAGVAFLALFGAVFFLLGRESRRRPPIAQLGEPAAPQPVAPMPTATAPMPTAPMPTSTAPLPTSTAPMPTAAEAIAPVEPPPPPRARPAIHASAPPPPDDTAAARSYFTQMQAIQTIAGGTDTNEAANKLLTASMTGDTSGFDELIKAAQAGAAQARAIQPPPCCVAYHEHLLGLLGESVTMVQQIKRAMATNDAASLSALAASGSSLQTRASALEAEGKQIKAGLGIR
jgi:type IV secretory pathway VirB10-like protein